MKKPKLRVLLGLPCYGGFAPHVVGSICGTQALGFVRDVWVKPYIEENTLVHRARNLILNRFLAEENFDYLLFADSDMVWPPKALWQLLAHKKDLVGGLYFQRVKPHRPVYAKKLSLTKEDPLVKSDLPGPGLHEVEGLGMGFTLISKKLAKAIAEKYRLPFQYMSVRDGESELSEDYTFCVRAKEVGFQPFLDADLGVYMQHGGSAYFGAEDYMAYRRAMTEDMISEEALKVKIHTPQELRQLDCIGPQNGNGRGRLHLAR